MNKNELRLGVWLNSDPYYAHPEGTGADVKRRFDSGKLIIAIGENTWPEGWYKDPYFNVSVPLTLELAHVLPEANNFSLFYKREIDFHHIMFDYDGDTYCVQWYKIFTVHRKSDGKRIYMDSKYSIADFFKSGRYKTTPHWEEGGTRYKVDFESPTVPNKA